MLHREGRERPCRGLGVLRAGARTSGCCGITYSGRGAADSANNFLLKDRCALIDQMSFFVTLPGGGFVLAVRDWGRADKNEISVFVFSVATDDLPHDRLLHRPGHAHIII
jgi:hypothetical protein